MRIFLIFITILFGIYVLWVLHKEGITEKVNLLFLIYDIALIYILFIPILTFFTGHTIAIYAGVTIVLLIAAAIILMIDRINHQHYQQISLIIKKLQKLP